MRKASFRAASVLILVLLFGACQHLPEQRTALASYIPAESYLVLKINNLNTFKSELRNNKFLEALGKRKSLRKTVDALKFIENIETDQPAVLCFLQDGAEKHFLFVTHPEPVTRADSTAVSYTPSTQGKVFVISSSTGDTLYRTELKGFQLFSSNSQVLNEIVDGNGRPLEDSDMLKDFHSGNLAKSGSVFLNPMAASKGGSSMLKSGSSIIRDSVSQWLSWDFETGQQQLRLSGIARSRSNPRNPISLFEDALPQLSAAAQVAPASSQAILSFPIDDFERFKRQQKDYLDATFQVNSVFRATEEISMLLTESGRAVVLRAIESESIDKYLRGISRDRRDYQGRDIAALTKTDLLEAPFEPLITDFEARYYTVIEDSFIFAQTEATLEHIISNFSNGSVFAGTQTFQTAEKSIADDSNLLMISRSGGLDELLASHMPADVISDLKAAAGTQTVFSFQLVPDNGFSHLHLSVQETEKALKTNATSPLFTVQLDTAIINTPQFVSNHRNGKKEIVVQDAALNLYLISSEGKVLWKKKLSSPIQGKVAQVDLYKNGKLQLAFTTQDQFLILDRNGEIVKPFDMSFPGGNLNPLAVFDYENNKNYRFVLTQGEKVMMYNSSGKIVSGFTYTRAASNILRAPKHLRIGSRDYLVFQLENGELKILNRVGQTRVTVDEKFDFSANPVFLYRNNFVFTDKKGLLTSIDTKGKIGRIRMNYNEDHRIDATAKTLAAINDNSFSVKGKTVEMELGVYTAPQIFYIYDKIYVATADLQNQRIFLYDSQARPISNFPVFGNSPIDLADIDRDGTLELVTRDQDNSLIVYALR